jgi:hypothetical protein
MDKKQYPPTVIPTIISVVMLLAGIPKFFPYGYYTLLRLVVCGTGIYIAVFSFEKEKKSIAFPAGFIALLFNPLIPIHLTKEIWVIIDFITAIFFFLTLFLLRTSTFQTGVSSDE